MSLSLGQVKFFFVYPVLPWIGVMLLGFGVAPIFEQMPEKRNAQLLKIGVSLTIAFVVIRALGVYGDPREWHYQPDNLAATLMLFFNTTKYPPSLHYLLMTLGPAAMICAYADRMQGWWKEALIMFGRVPFTFYVAHILIVHCIAVLIGMYQGFTFIQMATTPFLTPKQYGLDLPGVYLVWLLAVVLLYPVCRWGSAIKARRTDWWLSYV